MCHKYSFINPENGVHTQAVELVNNRIKTEIKTRLGVKTASRENYIQEFCFFFNNKESLVEKFMDLVRK